MTDCVTYWVSSSPVMDKAITYDIGQCYQVDNFIVKVNQIDFKKY